MNKQEAKEYSKIISYRDAIFNATCGKCIPYRKATMHKLFELMGVMDGLTDKEIFERLITNNNSYAGFKFNDDMGRYDHYTDSFIKE